MTRATILIARLLVASGCLAACARERGSAPSTGAATSSPAPRVEVLAPPDEAKDPVMLPDYLVRLAKHGDLYARDGGAIVSAPAADIAVLRGYPRWKDKGPLIGSSGERLTILTAKTVYAIGEPVRVIHVHEATKPGVELYVMGPKEIFGEYVDGKLASKAAASPPSSYDGAVVPSPGADHNYEVSVHQLAAGVHTLEWRFATLSSPLVLRSNVLTVEVR